MTKPAYLLLATIAFSGAALCQTPEPPAPVSANGPWVVTVHPQNKYKSKTAYAIYDLVAYENNYYVSMVDLNKDNTPTSSSSYWQLLPSQGNTEPTVAGWGVATVNTEVITLPKARHFKTADSYTCAATEDLQEPPPGDLPQRPGLGGGKPEPPKAPIKFTNQSGSQFSIAPRKKPPSQPIGYVCSGQ
jgi:hypothetical protein